MIRKRRQWQSTGWKFKKEKEKKDSLEVSVINDSITAKEMKNIKLEIFYYFYRP